jgi:hypothetical protein
VGSLRLENRIANLSYSFHICPQLSLLLQIIACVCLNNNDNPKTCARNTACFKYSPSPQPVVFTHTSPTRKCTHSTQSELAAIELLFSLYLRTLCMLFIHVGSSLMLKMHGNNPSWPQRDTIERQFS